jgi:antitoxin component YwqK of YwqJK toxin-antitoxin module
MTESDEPIASVADFPNGRRKYEGFLLDGEMHGTWTWWRTDGSRMRTGAFVRGKQVGVWRTYDRAGAVVKETTVPEA